MLGIIWKFLRDLALKHAYNYLKYIINKNISLYNSAISWTLTSSFSKENASMRSKELGVILPNIFICL